MRVLKLEGNPWEFAWRGHNRWQRALKRAAPDLAAIVAAQSPAGDVIDLIRRLRNTVHGAALQPMTIGRNNSRPERTAVLLPAEDSEKIAPILQRRQWTSAVGWGRRGARRNLKGSREATDPANLDRMGAGQGDRVGGPKRT